jgi:hypothetical protein
MNRKHHSRTLSAQVIPAIYDDTDQFSKLGITTATAFARL